jgi:hypothetical protein
MSSATTSPPLSERAVDALAAVVRGRVVRPGDPTFAEHRNVWNGAIDRRPAVIVRCANVEDVTTAVKFARDHELLTAVRGGGHSFPGYSTCDGGLVIDLGPMQQIDVDPANRTVRAEAGVLLGEIDHATQRDGVAVPAGIVSHTGIGGLTLGGGLGWQQRRHGLTIDNLVSADVVTADGTIVRASADEHTELFWGLRGGGGNFGVVTSFTYWLNAVGPLVMAGPIFWAMADAPAVLRAYRDWVADCPDELTTIVVQRRLPTRATVPRELVGQNVIAIVACVTSSVEAGQRVMAPMKRFGRPLLDLCEPKPFVVHQRMFDESYRAGAWYYVRSCDVDALTDDVIDTMVEHGHRIESMMSSVALWQMGGAVARVGDDETAFHGRQAGFSFNINGNTPTAEGFEDERAWARTYWSALSPHHTSVYVNFLMDEGDERIREAYGHAKHARLKALKRTFDPTNLFRLNQNIRPD